MDTDVAERSEVTKRPRGSGGATRMRQAAMRQRFLAVLVLFVVIFIYFSLTQSRFFTSANLDALMTSAAVLWMVAIGLTFVMLTGGFDLSLGSLLAAGAEVLIPAGGLPALVISASRLAEVKKRDWVSEK